MFLVQTWFRGEKETEYIDMHICKLIKYATCSHRTGNGKELHGIKAPALKRETGTGTLFIHSGIDKSLFAWTIVIMSTYFGLTLIVAVGCRLDTMSNRR